MTKREKATTLFIELINTQLEPHGVTYEDVKSTPEWFMKYKTTQEKEKEFLEHCISRIQTVLKINKSMATKEAQWFILQWGLTIDHSQLDSKKTDTNKNEKAI